MTDAARDARATAPLSSMAWAAFALVLPIVLVSSMPMGTVDLLYHLRAGATMLSTRSLLRADTFTFTASGLPWLDQQWLSQVLFAAVFERAGGLGLALLRTVLSIGVLSLLFAAARARGAHARGATSARAYWFTLVGACLLLPTLQLRPQLFGLVAFAWVMWVLSDRHRHPGRVWSIVPVMLLWANLHGTFFLAVGLIGLAWIDDVAAKRATAHRLIPIGLAAIAATCVNPFGPGVWAYVVALTSNESVRKLATEWQPTSVDSFSGAAFLLSLPLVTWRVARARPAVSWPTLLLLGSFMLIGLLSVRGVYWWAIVAPVVLAGLPAPELPTPASTPAPMPRALAIPSWLIVAVCATLALVPMLRWAPYRSPTTPWVAMLSDAPVGITNALQRTLAPGERVFNAQMWGSWLEFTLPTNPVVVDSRIELIPGDVWDRYADVANARDGWHESLTSWQVRVVALSSRQQPRLIQRMKLDSRWQITYEDAEGVVFTRR